MLNFYYFTENTKFQTLSGKLSWSHYCELPSIKDLDEINYYIRITEEQKLSVRELRTKIKNNEYERFPEETKVKLTKNKESSIED